MQSGYLSITFLALSVSEKSLTSSVKVPSATQTTVVGIASTYRSVKVLVEISPDIAADEGFNKTEWPPPLIRKELCPKLFISIPSAITGERKEKNIAIEKKEVLLKIEFNHKN